MSTWPVAMTAPSACTPRAARWPRSSTIARWRRRSLHSVGVLAQCRGDFAGAREALLDSLARLREVPAGDSEAILSGAHGGAVRRG